MAVSFSGSRVRRAIANGRCARFCAGSAAGARVEWDNIARPLLVFESVCLREMCISLACPAKSNSYPLWAACLERIF